MALHLTRRELMQMSLGGAAALAGARFLGAAVPGSFHLGLVTYNVAKEWDLDTILRLLPEAGFEGVEFRSTHAHGVEVSLGADQRAEIRRRCAAAGMKQVSLGTACEFHSPDPAVVRKNVEEVREWVLLARDLGARGIKVRPNGLPEGVPVEKTLDQIGGALAECGDLAAEHGVEIWVEVHGQGT
jgi:sugar phosphate isomerase/epimerase